MAIVYGRQEVGDFIRQTLKLLVNLEADFEQPEGVFVFAVLGDIFPNARQQRHAQQRLVLRDGVGHTHVRSRIQAECRDGLFAEEGVIVDFREALVHQNVAHFVLELPRRIAGRNLGGHQRRLGRDGVVADHAAHFFH